MSEDTDDITRLTAFSLGAEGPEIRPAPVDRGWMDATPEGFAYRCLPLAVANAWGWEMLAPAGFSAVWTGGAAPGDVVVSPDDPARQAAIGHFGSGILTFHVPWLFRTAGEVALMVQGPLNRPKDAIAPLSGLVETGWSPFGFTMNWRFTRPETPVRFEAGEPFAAIIPVLPSLMEAMRPDIRPIDSDPATARAHAAFVEGRSSFLNDLGQDDSAARRAGWQKDYFRGRGPGGTAPQAASHRTKLRLRPFHRTPTADTDRADADPEDGPAAG
ncbi:DUF6065 family protein [Tistrella sp. BH-R2-4]|uniref:DUF6065 family protein n=1 Tax=Tistrella arctica TaxID=3133430 RepID=A0ABU9YSK4_9PROT